MRELIKYPAFKTVIEEAEKQLQVMTGTRWRINAQTIDQDYEEERKLRKIVCEVFKVYWKDIECNSRKRVLVDARHTYVFCCYKYLGFTSEMVGEFVNMDHSSVLYAVKKMMNMIAINDPVKDQFMEVKTKLFSNEA